MCTRENWILSGEAVYKVLQSSKYSDKIWAHACYHCTKVFRITQAVQNENIEYIIIGCADFIRENQLSSLKFDFFVSVIIRNSAHFSWRPTQACTNFKLKYCLTASSFRGVSRYLVECCRMETLLSCWLAPSLHPCLASSMILFTCIHCYTSVFLRVYLGSNFLKDQVPFNYLLWVFI